MSGSPKRNDMEAGENATGDGGTDRRGFFSLVTVAVGSVAGIIAALPALRVLLWPAAAEEPDVWRAVGVLDEFPIGATRKVTFLDPEPVPWAGFSARAAAWVRRESETGFVAFSIYCTHTACPVRWDGASELFLCPCHGGAFYSNGEVAAGPPRRPLVRHPIRVRGGTVEVRTTGLPLPAD